MRVYVHRKKHQVKKENISTVPLSYINRYYERFLGHPLKLPFNDFSPPFAKHIGLINVDYLARSVCLFQENKTFFSRKENISHL